MRERENDSFIMYQRYETQLHWLTMEQRGELFTAIFAYNRTGELPNIPDTAVRMALGFITEQMSYDKKKYAEKCAINRANGARSHSGKQKTESTGLDSLPNGNERYRTVTNATLSDTDTDSDSYTDSDSDSERGGDAHAHAHAHTREARGKYKNVQLTDAEYDELQREVRGLDGLIDQLSSYMQSSGKRYEDHAATLRLWADRERMKQAHEPVGSVGNAGDFDTDEFFAAALERGERYGDAITGTPPTPETAKPP